jgi:hypothetical protein
MFSGLTFDVPRWVRTVTVPSGFILDTVPCCQEFPISALIKPPLRIHCPSRPRGCSHS